MWQERARWLLHCPDCGLECSRLDEEDHAGSPSGLAEDHREEGLEGLRRSNFERVLDRITPLLRSRNATLLDVGCGHGWFLDAASRRGLRPAGIEPDQAVVEMASGHGPPVRVGRFPDCVQDGERWDVVAMNDVFEHLPDPRGVLLACHRVLTPEGLLVINIPSSDGLLYRVARLFDRCGSDAAIARLWQKGFPSPHLYYFNDRNLAGLVRRHGFELVSSSRLPSIQFSGLWSRVRMDRRTGFLGAVIQSSGLTLLFPFLRWLGPSDITLHIYRRR